MRFLARLIVLVALLTPAVLSQTPSASASGLSPGAVPADCKIVEGNYPVDIQTAILWDKTDLYKSMIPLPIAKTAQSFACRGEKGTVYFFRYADEASRKSAGAFLKGLLWGEPGPTADHPELVLEAGDVLIVVSFQKPPKALLATLQSGAVGTPENKRTSESSEFSIPGHGSLWLKVPNGWQVQSRQLADPASVTLHFAPASGDAFDVQVTAVWLDAQKRSRETPDALQDTAQHAATELLPHSVEKAATIKRLQGPQSVGYYYALTDNNPGPGEFTNLTQGVFLTDAILSTFTILHRTAATPEVEQALKAFSEATYVK
jgi:hypothetical protein